MGLSAPLCPVCLMPMLRWYHSGMPLTWAFTQSNSSIPITTLLPDFNGSSSFSGWIVILHIQAGKTSTYTGANNGLVRTSVCWTWRMDRWGVHRKYHSTTAWILSRPKSFSVNWRLFGRRTVLRRTAPKNSWSSATRLQLGQRILHKKPYYMAYCNTII
jgi:hypothetical protein